MAHTLWDSRNEYNYTVLSHTSSLSA